MRLKYFQYIQLVKAAYQKKRVSNELSPLLAQSTPANIRRECEHVYEQRFEKRDEANLRAFFGPGEQGRKFLAIIHGFDVNRFKPLDSFLKTGGKKGISDRNLDLLAWLIDFPHRPYDSGKNVILSEEEMALMNGTGETLGELDSDEIPGETGERGDTSDNDQQETSGDFKNEPLPPVSVPRKRGTTGSRKIQTAGLAILTLILVGGGAYLVRDNKGECMYWAGDHYETVVCDEKKKGRTFFALDEERTKSLQKITREDTITAQSIGVLYYLKTDKKPEYFTAGGEHPVYTSRKLKILSQHIFDTYLKNQNVVGKDSLALQSMK
jgi:hypothetical protein